ncbi:MAG: Transcriptional regulator, TetR family protein [Labilithrix sp.]|nr:Transcriptional regulator, TetR family protein [Labilithrix sp.]
MPTRKPHGRRNGSKPEPAAVDGREHKRVRRSPEEARTLLLDAAERVFAEHLPDVVGLKDVAREAGVSHALVTHYFGTYDALVEATLERRFQRIRDELVPEIMSLATHEADTSEMLSAHRRAVAKASSDPATVRLATWALLSGRAAADDFFPHRMQGLKLLTDALAARSTAPREDLELLLVASFTLTIGWMFGRRAFAGALGRKPSRELDDAFDRRIDTMLETYLRAAERRAR